MDYSLAGGVALGLALGLTPGPVVTEIIRRGTSAGLRPALGVAAGAAVGNIACAGLAFAGTGALQALPRASGALALLSAGWIAYLALDAWRQAGRVSSTADTPSKGARPALPGWLAGLLMVVTNPVVWGFWLAVMAAGPGAASPGARAAFAAGFVVGITGSDVALATVSARGGRRLGPRGQAWALRLCALLLLAFAVRGVVLLI